MTFTDAAAEILRIVGRPLHYKEITDIAIERNLLSHVGKSPEVTMGARLAATLKKDSGETRLVRVKPGIFALSEWNEKTIREGLAARKASPRPSENVQEEDEEETSAAVDEIEAIEVEEAIATHASAPTPELASPKVPESTPKKAMHSLIDSDDVDISRRQLPDDDLRAEAAAGAAEMFDEEDDDDEPILGGMDDRQNSIAPEGQRRRRRRRRGRTLDSSAMNNATNGGGYPSFTAAPAFEPRRESLEPRRENNRDNFSREAEPPRGPQVLDMAPSNDVPLDDLAGKDLADAVFTILTSFDRNLGPVSLRQIADVAARRGKLLGDPQLIQSQIAASIRADNLRRSANGNRPRFRFTAGRVSLTDWLLGGDLSRFEQDAIAAVDRYRDAVRRTLVRRIADLPGQAFVEMTLLLLERMGVTQIRSLRRPGMPGNEAHFSGTLKASGGEIRLAIVIRRDGREIGRERVTELRGSLHHYENATIGWILTSGQLLSGAREEAATTGVAPIVLYDGFGIARLCEEHEVGVVKTRLPVFVPDVDLFEALRAV